MTGEARLRNYLVILIDIFIVFLCFYIVLIFGNEQPFAKLINLRKIVYLPAGATVLIFIFTDMYRNIFKRYIEILFNCALAGIAGTILFAIFVNVRAWHNQTVKISYIFVLLLLIAFLGAERILVEFLYRLAMKTKSIAVVGPLEQCMKTGYDFIKNKKKTHEIKYIFDVDGNIDMFEKYLDKIDIVIVCSGTNKEKQDWIVEICARNETTVFLTPKIYEINTMRPKLTQIDDTPYLYFDSKGLTSEERVFKRIFDIAFSFFLLIAVSPILAVCAILIKLDSKGPVFFRQERVTEMGIFRIYKLRTMITDAEKKTGAVLSYVNDDRITSFGKFLRKTRIDEVPQIINVLKGEMSLIGPRPERPEFVAEFCKQLPDYDKRHSVKAGISGLAQIMGKYSTSAEDKLRYDLIYIRNYSIIMDIKIFFLTLKTVFLEPGSILENENIDYTVEIEKFNVEIIK
ncbi:MAG: sugar transferase [Clostridia bacterium]|nr:sugar transferase [Clostridia bacterium]MBN2882061.1 sugar transferase [Clostridia bacterium]